MASATHPSHRDPVLGRIAHFARTLCIAPRIEPAGLHSDDRRRPDIQMDLPEVTLLGDVTISHPLAKSWQKVAASARGVEAVGDAREAEKNDLYADMAEECAMEFCAIVLYTYGGFHSSALSFIQRMAKAVDPATCLTSPSRWRRELMEQMAIALQRGNADIMITAAQRMRGKAWTRRRRLYPAPLSNTSSRSSGRGGRRARRNADASDSGSHEEGQPLPHTGRGMTCAARLIGLSDHEAVSRGLGCSTVDSDADTEGEDEDGLPSSSSPSFVAGTPLSSDGGLGSRMQMNALQGRETGECGASVRADGMSHYRDAGRQNCTIAEVVTAVAVTAVAAAVVAGDGMQLEEEAVADGVCGCDVGGGDDGVCWEMEKCVDGGGAAGGVGV